MRKSTSRCNKKATNRNDTISRTGSTIHPNENICYNNMAFRPVPLKPKPKPKPKPNHMHAKTPSLGTTQEQSTRSYEQEQQYYEMYRE